MLRQLTNQRTSAFLLTAALAVAACGGDEEEASPTDAPAAASDTTESPTATSASTAPTSTAPASTAPEATVASEPGTAQTVEIVDAQERTVEVPVNPETVVVMDWAAIRTLTALGVEVDAAPAPVGTPPADLAPVADSATQVGTLFEPDYEAIAALEPDVIIVGSRSGTPEVVAEMEKITPAVVDLSVRYENAEDQIPQFRERTLQLASIFDEQAKAEQALDAIDAEIAAVAAEAEASGLQAMFVQVSGGVVGAYGPGSRFGLVYDNFGFAPTDAPVDEEGSHGQEISQEFFVAYNPGVIYVLDRGKVVGEEGAPALDVLNNGLVETTDAAQSGKIIEVDGFSWYIATHSIPSMQQIVADVRAGLS